MHQTVQGVLFGGVNELNIDVASRRGS